MELCADYSKKKFCVHMAPKLDRRRIFAVLAFNKDLIGENAERRLEPCRRFSAAMVASEGRPQAADPLALEAASMVYAKPVFSSIGLSLRRETLDEIVPMADPEYYEDPAAYIARRFYSKNMTSAAHGSHHLKDSYGTADQFTEQDGILNRLLIENEAVSVLPRCPRAFHAGFVGYNRKHEKSNGEWLHCVYAACCPSREVGFP